MKTEIFPQMTKWCGWCAKPIPKTEFALHHCRKNRCPDCGKMIALRFPMHECKPVETKNA